MDQLLNELYQKFKLLEEIEEFDPAEIAEFKKRRAAEIAHDERYQEYLKSQQGNDSSNSSSDITKMSASEIVKELNAALDREGIKIPESGGNLVEDILAAIQTYKKSMNLPTDADALVKLLRLTPPKTNPTNKGVAGGDIGAFTAADMAATAAAKPEEEEPEVSKMATPVGDTLGQFARTGVDTVSKFAGDTADALSRGYTNTTNALSGVANGFKRGYNRTDTKESVVYPRLSESDEMARLVSRLTRLDETTELNEVRFPEPIAKLLDNGAWLLGKKSRAEVADLLGQTPKLFLKDGTEIATKWARQADDYFINSETRIRLSAKQLVKFLDKEKATLEKTFGVTKGTQFTSDAGQTFTKQADGSWLSQDGVTLIKKTDPNWARVENLATKPPVVPGANPSTTIPTSTPKPPTGPTATNPASNILKPNSLPANLSWAAKSKRFLKYSAALAALGLVFDNGDLIMSGVKQIADYVRGSETPDAKPDATPGTSSDTAATDAKNSEEIKKLVKEIQDLQQKHGKDSDPAWSKAVDRANAVFKRLGIPPFDNSIPKPKPVAPAPRPVASPAPVAAASAVPPESVVPQDMVQPVDLQQDYQQQPAYQRNSNTFIPIPIPLGGFGGGRGNGGGRGPQNGRGYPGAGGQLRGGVGTPGGGNRGGR
jgi:hypothetical protein